MEEKKRGLAAKDRVIEILKENNNKFLLKSHGVGKYGRCLGELHIDVVDGQEKITLESVNKLLIKEGHAVEYHGGAKADVDAAHLKNRKRILKEGLVDQKAYDKLWNTGKYS